MKYLIILSIAYLARAAPPCPKTVKCCTAAPNFCHTTYDNRSFCDPSTQSTQQLGDGCSCPFGAKADAGKCSGGPAPSSGWFCKHGIQVNACGKCSGDADCGNETHACWAFKDVKCPKAIPFLQTPADPTSGFCTHDSPKNSCKPCSQEEDCGHSLDGKVWYCQKAKDAVCGGTGSKGYCNHGSPQNSCGACNAEEDCGHSLDNKTWYCHPAKDAECGGHTKGFCTFDSPNNKCAGCNAEEDCGHTLDGKVWYCQGHKDGRCPMLEELHI